MTIDDAVYYQMRRDLQAYAKEKRKLQRQLAEALAKVGQLMAFAHNLEFGSDAK